MDIEEISGCIISISFTHHKIDALFYHLVMHEEHVRNKPIVLRLHGILGNLLDETEHDLPQILAKHGYSSITMNTILANLGLFFGFGIFEDAMNQIHAVCHYLREMGWGHVWPFGMRPYKTIYLTIQIFKELLVLGRHIPFPTPFVNDGNDLEVRLHTKRCTRGPRKYLSRVLGRERETTKPSW